MKTLGVKHVFFADILTEISIIRKKLNILTILNNCVIKKFSERFLPMLYRLKHFPQKFFNIGVLLIVEFPHNL